VDAVLQAARRSPLLGAVARSGLASCRVVLDGSAVEVTYRARDGSRFRFRRDSAIEGSEFEVRFAGAPTVDVRQLLRRSEIDAFGPGGCGIDWAQAGEAASAAAGKAKATVYRGQACNCQGRAERAASGALRRLVFSSAC
ncbi:MAG: hypothetical protein M3Z16_12420, partial [Pseudomonadota bacterium]|nr:hypothetical protein [Pseudomonadota bacterium]